MFFIFFFFNDTATTEIYTLSHTTLFRSPSWCSRAKGCATSPPRACLPTTSRLTSRGRSEEHTSELQSQSNLVCRLLLEKKKKREKDTYLAHTNQIYITTSQTQS